nr:LysR family transcriptional regulator ArgP [uncultured Devosia sp.]
MIDYSAAAAIATIVRLGSFEKAAKALNVTPSAISQRVKQLEERLGTVLIERGSPCRATDKGAWLCRHMDQVDLLERSLFEQMPELGDVGRRTVTLDIAVNADSLGTWFLPAVASFAERSKVLLNIEVDDQEHTVDWLQRGRVVAAVTSLKEPVAGCAVTGLGSLRYHATASPEFMRRHFPDGVTSETIGKAPALTFNQKDSLQQDWVAAYVGGQVATQTHWLPSTQGFVEACLLGMGWGLNPVHLVEDHLRAGRLVELVAGAVMDVPLYWQVSRWAAKQFPDLSRDVVAAGRRMLQRDSNEKDQ